MCVLNGERFLEEALTSIDGQRYPSVEIVFIDDGSSDRTGDIATSGIGPVRYTYQENRGVPAARNTGVDLAEGDYLTFLDADDWWAPGRLEYQIQLLEANRDIDIVLGHTRRTWARDTATPGQAGAHFTEPEVALSLSAALIRRSVFERIGRFNESLRYCDDWDWFMRAREVGVTIATHPETVLFYRRHEGNITNDTGGGNRDFARVLKASLDRRREAGAMDLTQHRELE
jgi:glycosyltransferase involved in cell wall biosynthesis